MKICLLKVLKFKNKVTLKMITKFAAKYSIDFQRVISSEKYFSGEILSSSGVRIVKWEFFSYL